MRRSATISVVVLGLMFGSRSARQLLEAGDLTVQLLSEIHAGAE